MATAAHLTALPDQRRTRDAAGRVAYQLSRGGAPIDSRPDAGGCPGDDMAGSPKRLPLGHPGPVQHRRRHRRPPRRRPTGCDRADLRGRGGDGRGAGLRGVAARSRPARQRARGAGPAARRPRRDPAPAGPRDGRRPPRRVPGRPDRRAAVRPVRPRRARVPAAPTPARARSSPTRRTGRRSPRSGTACPSCGRSIVVGGGGIDGTLDYEAARARRRAGSGAATRRPTTRRSSSTRRARPGRPRARCMPIASCSATCRASCCRTTSRRSAATSSGRRPTGPGSAACTTSSFPAWHWGLPVVAHRAPKFDPERALDLMARHGSATSSCRRPRSSCIRRSGARPPAGPARCGRSASGGETLGGGAARVGARRPSASRSTSSTARPNATSSSSNSRPAIMPVAARLDGPAGARPRRGDRR